MEEYELTPQEIQQLFGKHQYDPYWKNINQQLDDLWHKAHETNNPKIWLDYYIQLTQRSLEYLHNEPKLCAHDPIYDFTLLDFHIIDSLYIDAVYFHVEFLVNRDIDRTKALELLLINLESIKNNRASLDEFTKKKIRKQLWDEYKASNCTFLFYDYFESL